MIKLITNSTIQSIIKGTPDGIEKSYLVSGRENKLNKIIYVASLLKKGLGNQVAIEAKYNYGFRNIRIEIAFLKDKLFLLKILSDFKKIDKEAIKIDAIISKMKVDYGNIEIVGCIVLDCDYKENVIDSVKSILNNNLVFIDIKQIEMSGVEVIKNSK